jgi:hypothetical protein
MSVQQLSASMGQYQQQHQQPIYTSAGEVPAIFNTTETPPYPSLGVIEEMLNAPAAQLDWRLYDSRVSGVEETNQDNFWFPAAPPAPLGVDYSYPPGGNS